MVIVDENDLIKNVIASLEIGDISYSEDHQYLSFEDFSELDLVPRREILLINTLILSEEFQKIENVKSLLKTFFCVIFFSESPETFTQNYLIKELFFLKNTLGVFSFSLSNRDKLVLNNQIQFIWQIIQEEKEVQKKMASFSAEFDFLLKKTEEEMIKTKKLHGMLIPRRFEEIKGIKFYTKYLAGNLEGSEFCDVFQSPSKTYAIFISSDSYLMTSSIMGVLLKHKEKFSSGPFITDVKNEIEAISSSKKKNLNTDVLVLEIDPFSLQMKFLTDSNVQCFSQLNGRIVNKEHATYQMEKGERLFVLSSGLMKNWNNRPEKSNLELFFKTQAESLSPDLMSELFFQLKDNLDEKFPSKDSTAMILEINRHGIQKI